MAGLIRACEIFKRKAVTICSAQQGQPRYSLGPQISWVPAQAGSCFPKSSVSLFDLFASLVIFFYQPCLHFKARSLSLFICPSLPQDILHSYTTGAVLPVIMSSGTQRLVITERRRTAPILHQMGCPSPSWTISALLGSLALLLPMHSPLTPMSSFPWTLQLSWATLFYL